MGGVRFIADPHIGHKNILKYRPQFKTVNEHDEFFVSQWNKNATKRTLTWVLGDFLIYNKFYDMKSFLARLKGNIRIILGNHDHVDYYPKNLISPTPVNKYKMWLSHVPLHPLSLRGKYNIHGHTHNLSVPDNRYINVCCEQTNFIPVNLDELRKGLK